MIHYFFFPPLPMVVSLCEADQDFAMVLLETKSLCSGTFALAAASPVACHSTFMLSFVGVC